MLSCILHSSPRPRPCVNCCPLSLLSSLALSAPSLPQESQLAQLRLDLQRLDNRVRFILMVIRGELVVSNRKKTELLAELRAKKFAAMSKSSRAARGGKAVPTQEEEETSSDSGEEEEDEEGGEEGKAATGNKAGYDYLLGMPLWSLTLERVQQLVQEQKEKRGEYEELLRTEPRELWDRDLTQFLEVLEVRGAREGVGQRKERGSSLAICVAVPAPPMLM